LRPCPFARETVPKLALSAKPNPARQYHLARRGTARSLQFAQTGKPAFSRSCSLPSGTFFADHDPAWAGVDQSRVRVFGAGVHGEHPRIQSSSRTRQARPLYRDRDSRVEQYICECVRYPRWSSSKFAGNFGSAICGAICSAFANVTNVELPTRYAPRGRNLRKYGAAVEMH
jgi:hypothetical protein